MPKVVGIKFRNGGKLYWFNRNIEVETNQQVVVETSQGKEIGTVVNPNIIVDDKELTAPLADIVRIATAEDIKKHNELTEKNKDTLTTAQNLIKQHGLEMKLVAVETPLDGGKIVISFTCEDRVDFRDLVKDLAAALKQRVELKQIGVRDQAKAVGGIGLCGQECCCSRYLNDFDKVSIKMAKTQNLSLNPVNISGVCGRLMCCLSYENDFYTEALRGMPRVGSEVRTPDGNGIVTYNNIFKNLVTVRIVTNDETKYNTFNLSDIKFNKFAYGGEEGGCPHKNNNKKEEPKKEEVKQPQKEETEKTELPQNDKAANKKAYFKKFKKKK